MTLKDLKKELKRLETAEERLLDFLIHHPEHQQEAVSKIFEVVGLIISMKNIIEEMKRKSSPDDN